MDCNENTSAHIAVHFGHINYLKRLMELGANLEILNKNHHNCIIQAVISNQLDILVTLHTLGIELKQDPLSIIIVAAQYNRTNIIRFLHSNGFKVDDSMREVTPLAVAALNGHIDTIRLLHELCANFDAHIGKMTEVHAVAITGRLSALKVLDELGSKLNHPQTQGFTAAHLSALTNEIEIFQYLIEKSDYIPVSAMINFNILKAGLVSCLSMRKSQQVAVKGKMTFNLDRVQAFWRGKGASLSENIPLYPHDIAFLIGHDAIDAAFKAKFPHFNSLFSLPPPFPVGNYSIFNQQRNRITSSEPEDQHSMEESAPSKRYKKGG